MRDVSQPVARCLTCRKVYEKLGSYQVFEHVSCCQRHIAIRYQLESPKNVPDSGRQNPADKRLQGSRCPEIPAETAESRALSKDLKKRGFRFVGPTVCYALMQAAGLVDDHTIDCFRSRQA